MLIIRELYYSTICKTEFCLYANNPYQCKSQQYILVRHICKLCKTHYEKIGDWFSCNMDQFMHIVEHNSILTV